MLLREGGVLYTLPHPGKWKAGMLVPVLSLASDLTLGKTTGLLLSFEVTVSGTYLR